MNIDTSINYDFTVTESTIPDYKMCTSISEWIHQNLSRLTDDNGKKLFNKVNYGFNEDSLKSFGKKSVADVYVDSITYDSDLQYTRPVIANSMIIFYVKGARDVSYHKTCMVHDYIMQQFIEDEAWKELPGIVRDTVVVNSQVMNTPVQKKMGVMGAFELRHNLY